jgi:hypothetical protein
MPLHMPLRTLGPTDVACNFAFSVRLGLCNQIEVRSLLDTASRFLLVFLWLMLLVDFRRCAILHLGVFHGRVNVQ